VTFRLAALVLALLALGVLAGASDAVPRATLRLDGVLFRPELALDNEARSIGLMRRQRAPRDGMLFVFPEPSSGGFWMKNTLVPLRIVFFDRHGRRVRALRMQPCRRDPCPIYDPGRSYRFALELGTSDRRPAKRLGPAADLRRLVSRAS
jgi:uncharacterized protein